MGKPWEREFTIILPKKDNAGRQITVDQISEVAKGMASHFGGVTVNPKVVGCWIGDSKKMVCEENTRLSSARDLDYGKKKGVWASPEEAERVFAEDRKFMHKLCKSKGIALGQETIFLQESVSAENEQVRGKYKKELKKGMLEHDPFRRNV